MSEAIYQTWAEYHAALIYEGLEALDRDDYKLPQNLKEGLRRYLAERIETGGFLRCVLESQVPPAKARGLVPHTFAYAVSAG